MLKSEKLTKKNMKYHYFLLFPLLINRDFTYNDNSFYVTF